MIDTAIPNTATPVDLPTETRRKVSDLFTREEIRMLTARSNAMGFWAVGSTWAIIAGAFALIAWAVTQPLALAIPTLALGLCILAGRQLCLAILMHDASHGSLFRTRWLNDVFADWTCARPTWNDLHKYRSHHFVHHSKTGTEQDSDISLVTPFPCSRSSLRRKFVRDLFGITGAKFLFGRLLMDLGYIKWTVAADVVRLPVQGVSHGARLALLIRNVWPTVVTNALLFGALSIAGHPWLYVAWVAAYVSPFSLFVRIRSLAEHACMERTTDMFRNTRTTRAGWLARATVAPLRVHYHTEHHVMSAVPYYRLPTMHSLLLARGAVSAPPGYLEVLKLVSSARA